MRNKLSKTLYSTIVLVSVSMSVPAQAGESTIQIENTMKAGTYVDLEYKEYTPGIFGKLVGEPKFHTHLRGGETSLPLKRTPNTIIEKNDIDFSVGSRRCSVNSTLEANKSYKIDTNCRATEMKNGPEMKRRVLFVHNQTLNPLKVSLTYSIGKTEKASDLPPLLADQAQWDQSLKYEGDAALSLQVKYQAGLPLKDGSVDFEPSPKKSCMIGEKDMAQLDVQKLNSGSHYKLSFFTSTSEVDGKKVTATKCNLALRSADED